MSFIFLSVRAFSRIERPRHSSAIIEKSRYGLRISETHEGPPMTRERRGAAVGFNPARERRGLKTRARAMRRYIRPRERLRRKAKSSLPPSFVPLAEGLLAAEGPRREGGGDGRRRTVDTRGRLWLERHRRSNGARAAFGGRARCMGQQWPTCACNTDSDAEITEDFAHRAAHLGRARREKPQRPLLAPALIGCV